MNPKVKVRCRNNGTKIEAETGSSLHDVYELSGLKMEHGPIVAKVNNKVEGMGFRLYRNKDVEFLDLTSPSGMRTYTRTLFFILCKSVHDLYPDGSVVIDIPVSNGYYCNLKLGRAVTQHDVDALRRRMQEIIDADRPIHRREVPTDEAIKLFKGVGAHSKVTLLETLGTLYTIYYDLDGFVDYFYGALMQNTGAVKLFGLEPYYDGLLLRIPSTKDPSVLGEMTRQDKMFEVFQEHHRWQDIVKIGTVGEFNRAVQKGFASDIINVSEALQEKKIAQIGDMIAERKGVRMVLIAGPSSSGKTTTCKRLSIQLMTHGIRPVQISLDDYFVDRERTPRDEKGDYDYECIHALDIDLINEQFNALFRGEEVELPRYNFQTGKSEKSGQKLQIGEHEILVVEGIHALNPELTAHIPEEQKFRVYASALTTILLDTHNYIPTTDNRLLRRIIRDVKYRGCSAQDTIKRWPSVRAGENKWIFPSRRERRRDVQHSDDLQGASPSFARRPSPAPRTQVPENFEEYAEAYRLRKFLRYFEPVSFDTLPPTSLLPRIPLEGSSFEY